MSSKSLSEKELLSYNSSSSPSPAFEVVTLACALVGGDTLQPCLWSSIPVIVSPLTGDELYHNALKFMQALLGSVPLAHIDDVCDAHVFCMDQPSIAGRFLCAAGYPNMKDYIDRFAAKYPEIEIKLKEKGKSNNESFGCTQLATPISRAGMDGYEQCDDNYC
jgi:nucleoside-diphosphate-sugar epimerase